MVLPEPCVDQLVHAFIVVASPEHRTAPDVIRVQAQKHTHAPRNNLIAMPLPVRHIAGMVDDDMARLSQSVMTYCLLYRDDGGCVRSLGLVGVERRLLGALGG